MPLPLRTADLPGVGGRFRQQPEDFVVHEIPAYPTTGQGEHVFAHVEKRGLTTPAMVGAVARALGVRDRDVGVAGMKDRHAVTRQWISLPPPVAPEQVLALALPDVTVLAALRHGHKLRTGHLRGNRFTLVLRGVGSDGAARAEAILAVLTTPPGIPNYYGEQRFGAAGDNAARGRALLAGTSADGAPAGRGRRDGRHDRLMLSALQSELFNTWLAARLSAGRLATALAGDVLHKVGGGLFVCEDPATDSERLLRGEVVLTGPMFGAHMRAPPPGSPAAADEDVVLAAAGLDRGSFARVARLAEGTRRDATVAVTDATVRSIDADALELCFTLPAGAYATTLLREVMKDSPGPADPTDTAPDPTDPTDPTDPSE
ncbi:MAG: tRNA pseudouridine(13) synthase TruD [Kofleriaceae bacterium]|jgi:tRNA pseudouridine13 synthase|nr:tRNA pseudouridine(13) synthase TruD [Kofleriaceae bacterium]